MNSTFATRHRPYADPHPVTELRNEALARRDEMMQTRTSTIRKLVEDAEPDNKDIQFWSMVYDFEQGPTITGRAQLLEQGIIPVPPQELTGIDLHDELWTVIEALSRCGIFITNTSHLTDHDLYCRLYYRILDEQTRVMPPSCEASEFIDCLHPMDLEHPLGKKAAKQHAKNRNNERRSTEPYLRGPAYNIRCQLNDRDSHLPRPDWS
jgi:hypothetical protein